MNFRATIFSRTARLRLGELTATSGGRCIDRVGIGLSLLCLLHCICLPFAVIAMPALELFPAIEGTAHGEMAHAFLLLFIVPAAYFGWIRGYREHRNIFVVATGMLGLALLILAFQFTDTKMHVILTSLGGVMIIIAHYINLRRLWCC